MDDISFEVLKVRAAICPQAELWPRPNFAGVTLGGDGKKPSMGSGGDLHWDLLHTCVSHAREHTLKTLGGLSAIDSDKTLSQSGKAQKKKAVAEAAISALEKPAHLTRARDLVEAATKKWDEKLGLLPKPPEDAVGAMLAQEIRGRLLQMKSPERMVFIDAHTADVAAAILTAPAWLSGLDPTELAVVKQRIEARGDPEIVKAKKEALEALRDAERGVRAGVSQIRTAADLAGAHDGSVAA